MFDTIPEKPGMYCVYIKLPAVIGARPLAKKSVFVYLKDLRMQCISDWKYDNLIIIIIIIITPSLFPSFLVNLTLILFHTC